MTDLENAVDSAAKAFSGVVRVDRGGDVAFAKAYGLAHRGYHVPNTIDTRFGIASGSKGLTALAVVTLIERGLLSLDTAVRSVLGADLPLVDDAVTVEQLLAHRSGMGDYIDEDDENLDVTDYVLPVPVHELATTESFVAVLDGHPPKFAPGDRFSYCNAGYVVLALIAERVSGLSYHDLVRHHVCAPAGMADTDFLRSDETPERTALGYLQVDGAWRTNVLHLPVVATGDGGIHTTAADISALWRALFAGAIVSANWVAEMVRPRSHVPEESARYGLGFWLHQSTDTVMLVGADAGVSFYSAHNPASGLTRTVLANTSDGAWPVVKKLSELLPD